MRFKSLRVYSVILIILIFVMISGFIYAEEPNKNGDCNGNGTVDLADAIYILTYLFRGGEEPNIIFLLRIYCSNPDKVSKNDG